MSTNPLDAQVVRRSPMNAPVPATSSLYPGALVPIPTAPVEDTLILRFPLPSAMMILLERFDASQETLAPIIVLPEPVVIPRAVLYPSAVLLEPVVLLKRVNVPSATLEFPMVLE